MPRATRFSALETAAARAKADYDQAVARAEAVRPARLVDRSAITDLDRQLALLRIQFAEERDLLKRHLQAEIAALEAEAARKRAQRGAYSEILEQAKARRGVLRRRLQAIEELQERLLNVEDPRQQQGWYNDHDPDR